MGSIFRRLLGTLTALHRTPEARAQDKDTPARHAGRALRARFLSLEAQSLGIEPSSEYPRVFGAAMDWPVGEHIATLVALLDGTASLYTTSTFGIIGGAGHASVKNAAQRFVKAFNELLPETVATTTHPYPDKERVCFFLLTFDGLRTVETEIAPIYSGSGKFAPLFGDGQAVITELRKMTEARS